MPYGGKRQGAGRPHGKGPYGESTKVMRIPESLVDDTRQFIETRGYKMPVFSSKVPAGHPSAADNHVEEHVNLFKRLFPDPENMGWAFASGDSMVNAGIHDGTPLIIHFKREPKNGDIVIGMINGEQTVKVLRLEKGGVTLQPESDSYQPIAVMPGMDFKINGVVVNWLGKSVSR